MVLHPTTEQQEVLDAVKADCGNIRINAFAGTGKSTTLRMIAEHNPRLRFLYLAFNKAVAKEAETKFPKNCEVRTVHSLAFKETLPTVSDPKNFFRKLQKSWKLRDYMKRLQMDKFQDLIAPGEDHYVFCSEIKGIVHRFKFSDQPKICFELLTNRQLELDPPLQALILNTAKRLWELEIDMKSDFPLDHNSYLKLWELSKPSLNRYDFILFDEAQDANPVMNSILSKLTTPKIYVGDQFQAIYGWNGAVNAMETIKPEIDLYLTKSWRFGNAIAQEANRLLRLVGKLKKTIDGNADIPSQLSKVDSAKQYTTIFRTNGALAEKAIELLSAQKRVYVEGGVKDLCNDLHALFSLKYGGRFSGPSRYKPFRTFAQVCEESKVDETIKRDLAFVDKFGPETPEVLNFLESAVLTKRTTKTADVILTTAHKAKGLEWNQVCLHNDFRFKLPENKYYLRPQEREELNLLYVSITRAKLVLETNEAYERFLSELETNREAR